MIYLVEDVMENVMLKPALKESFAAICFYIFNYFTWMFSK